MVYSASQNQWTYINNPNSVGQGAYASDSMLIGPRFFQAANRFAKGTPVTWGLNLAYEQSDYIARITQMASLVIQNCPNLDLVSFEIGNEPDLYLQNGFRTGSWSGQTYAQQWLDRASAIYQQVLKPNNLQSNFFEPGTTASTIGTTFQINDLYTTADIGIQANGSSNSYIASWNQHDYYYYIGVSTYPLTLYEFMTLSTTNDQFVSWTQQIQQAAATPYGYALREMGVVGPIGLEGITNTFGAALWSLNWLFYMATLNISSVQLHMTDNSNASAWQPIYAYNRQPFVRPIYYGIAAFDQIIGGSCQAQVSTYAITTYPGDYGGRLTAYSVYQAGKLATIVVINSNMANVSQTNKASVTVQLSLPTSLAGQVLHLAYLTNTGADATANTTFNGISYEESGTGLPTTVSTTDQTVTIASDGSASFTVRDTQAIVANIGSKVGNVAVNSAACAALATRSPGVGSTVSTSANSAKSSNAASSMRQSTSATGATTAAATATNGIMRLSSIIFSTLGAAFATGALLLWT